MRRVLIAGFCLMAASASLLPAQDHGGHGHDHAGEHAALGTVVFENTGAAAAQAAFLRGVALLHSFEYVDAGAAFREAREVDPSFALAYWMEALTTEHPLWGESDVPAARAILGRLAPTAELRLAAATSQRERAYGAAVEALFAADDRNERLLAFADSLRRLPDSYPDDLEAHAFASIAALVASYLRPAERAALVDEAIARGEHVFARNQQHPGAAHYLIHAFDNPQRAQRGLPFARVYAQIAPDAEHALHMPSHIFLQVGMWDEVVASNERAWAASRAWVQRRGFSGGHLDFHSLQWLQYGYLQQGRYAAARAVIDTARLVLAGAEHDDTTGPDPRTVITRLAFQYAAETGDWTIDLGPPLGEAADDGSPRHQFFARIDAYQRSIAAMLRGADLRSAAVPDTGQGLFSLHTRALRARAAADTAGWLEALQRAVEVENPQEPTGPPLALVSHELLADALLRTGAPGEAVTWYEQSLARRPNRPVALLGLARARAAAGDRVGAAEAYSRLLAAWERADNSVPTLEEVRRGAL